MLKKIAIILPLLSGIMWGSAGIFVRFIQNFGFDSVTVISSKLIFTSILLAIGMFIFDRNLFRIKLRDSWLFLGCGLLGMLFLNFGYNAAVEELTLAFAAVLLSLSPIFVMIFASFLFKEKITTRKVVCTIVAIIGCTLVSGVLETLGNVTISVWGIVLGVSAAFFYAIYGILSKMAMERGYSVFTVIFYSMLSTAIVLLPFTDWNILGEFAKAAPVGNFVFMLMYSVLTAILPYMLYTVAMGYIDAGKVAIMGAGGEPSAAMVFGCIFFHEIPSLLSIAGLIITIVALTFICLPDKTPEDKLSKASGNIAGQNQL